MREKITCFLPCRQGSQRVPRKNIKPFAHYNFGLIEIKLKQLNAAVNIDNIILSTDDLEIIEYASSLSLTKLNIHHRSECLSSSETSTDDLVRHALDLIPQGHILWSHVTSPFITANHYDEIINSYHKAILSGYDSLMTVTEFYGFLWQNKHPLNYDRQIEKWPRTQTLQPIYEVNSGVFLASSNIYRKQNDRIGDKPYLYVLDKLISHDIDWSEDFAIAECMVEKGLVKL